MKHRFVRPKADRRLPWEAMSVRLPLPHIIDDWLRRDRERREPKREQPVITPPPVIPAEHPKEEERKGPVTIPISEPD